MNDERRIATDGGQPQNLQDEIKSAYPWNVRADVAGFALTGPGTDTEYEAEIIAEKLRQQDNVRNVEVFEQ